MTRPVLVLAFVLSTPLAAALAAAPACAPAAPEGIAADLDSARAELAVGRHWHAARHLRALREAGLDFGPEETLLLARADAGWRNWEAVAAELAGRPWLPTEGGGLGLRLLGHAHEAAGEWTAAAGAFERWLTTEHGRVADDRASVLARRARALRRAGHLDAALEALDSAAAASPALASWQALELAEAAAEAGDTAALRGLSERMSDAVVRDRGWRLEAVAILAAGDSAGAVEAFEAIADGGASDARRAYAFDALARLALARRDTAAAVDHSESAFDLGRTSPGAVRSARRLLALDALTPERALDAARALDRAGADAAALEAYDLHFEAVEEPSEEARLARARLMAEVPARHDEAVRAFRALSTSDDTEIGAGALESWADLRRSQGRSGDVATLRGWLVERYPTSEQAVDYVFFRGDAAHDRQDFDGALVEYGRLQVVAPSMDRSGLARTRMAQIHLTRGDSARAIEVLRGYLEEYPTGRRWEEAAWWVGTLLRARGDDTAGTELLERVIADSPLSYYAVLAAESLDRPYALPGEPGGGGPPPLPEWMADELRTIDLLAAASLETGRRVRTEALTERALERSHDAALRLARELIERDHTLDGINLGWELRRRGMPWSRALLEVTYPLPRREMVWQAARARGLDPVLVAALVRQESAFDPDIVSRAGAIGLMQIMPETGRQLASAVGPRDFNTESLETPEINLHLGTRYLVELLERFDGSLPFVLSAYNAGPHRADQWKSFPEAADELRFTERIPYGETRDYVRLVTRNMALYRALYGDRPAS